MELEAIVEKVAKNLSVGPSAKRNAQTIAKRFGQEIQYDLPHEKTNDRLVKLIKREFDSVDHETFVLIESVVREVKQEEIRAQEKLRRDYSISANKLKIGQGAVKDKSFLGYEISYNVYSAKSEIELGAIMIGLFGMNFLKKTPEGIIAPVDYRTINFSETKKINLYKFGEPLLQITKLRGKKLSKTKEILKELKERTGAKICFKDVIKGHTELYTRHKLLGFKSSGIYIGNENKVLLIEYPRNSPGKPL